MYSKDEKDVYYLHKLLIATIFDNDSELYKRISNMYDLDTLEVFKNIVIYFSNENCISSSIKGNINKILIDGREIEDKNYNDRVNLINEIIGILNCQKKDESIKFYAGELYLRRRDKKYLSCYDSEVISEIYDINESIYNDFSVLLCHSNEISDEEFVSEFLPSLVDNALYYESLNMFLEECPSIFEDKLFRDRMNCVITMNKELSKTYNKENKFITKTMKKYK